MNAATLTRAGASGIRRHISEPDVDCSRLAHARLLAPDSEANPPAFQYDIRGLSKCGTSHENASPVAVKSRMSKPVRGERKPRGKPTRRQNFIYLDESKSALFQEVMQEYFDKSTGRTSKRTWMESRIGSDGDGPAFKGFEGCMKGVRLVPFDLPALMSAAPHEPVFVVEGPTIVRALQALGLTATCSPYGAGNWRDECSPHLNGRHVVVLPDGNKVGRDHAEAVARSVSPFAVSVRVATLHGLAEKGDVLDWLTEGGTVDELRRLAEDLPPRGAAPTRLKIAEMDEDEDERPRIVVGVRQDLVIDSAEVSLGKEPLLYSRANSLVRVLPTSGGRRKWHPDRSAGTPQIVLVEYATLSEMMSKNAIYEKPITRQDGSEDAKSVIPPQWAVTGLAARGVWPSIRELEAIIECPTIREDGSLLDTPGWDEETALLYLPNAAFDPIPDRPTLDDARKAAGELSDLVCDFPFKDERHKAAWLAALLTVIARFAIGGPVPMFLIDANNRGSGKSKLADLISAIATGRDMARKAYPEDDAEMRKVLTSLAMVGDRMTLFDNLPTGSVVGCSALDLVLTSMTYKDRPLATNKIAEFPWRTVLFATGNNILIQADTARRVIPCRIETEEIRPEEREDFKVKGDIIAHARKNRPRFIAAALTILRAHALAGRPMPEGLTPMDYVAWCKVVRGAVAWSTGIDPCETRNDARENDKDATTVDVLTAGWKLLCESQSQPSLTAARAVKILEHAESKDRHAALIELVSEWSREGRIPSARAIGNRMAKFVGRPSEHGSLAHRTDSGNRSWYVKLPKNPKLGGSGGSSGSRATVFAGESLNETLEQTERDLRPDDRPTEPPEPLQSPGREREYEI